MANDGPGASGSGGATILIIDDREDLAGFCRRLLGESLSFVHVTNAADAAPVLQAGGIAAVLVDRDFSRADRAKLLGPVEDVRNEGLRIVHWLRRDFPQLPVLMVTGYRDPAPALETAALGVDFLAWEDVIQDPDILRARLRRALETPEVRAGALLSRFRERGGVAESSAMLQVVEAVARAIPTRAPILLQGETGTGKDFLAFIIHALSGDSGRPFVPVVATALSPNLIEEELFGHKRGAFTGAQEASIGKLRHAHGGTLFLNEVGTLPLESQAKFLGAVEQRAVVPVGDVQSYPADFRLITATNRNLRALVESGEFRRDLYHRLAWHTVEIPPLRDRREDIPELVRLFLRDSGQGTATGIVGIAREAVDYLCDLAWPGNVRQLQSVITEASSVALHVITLADVLEALRRSGEGGVAPGAAAQTAGATPAGDRAACERVVFGSLTYEQLIERYYRYLLGCARGSHPRLAELAGISKSTAYDWRDRYGGAVSGESAGEAGPDSP